MFAFLDKPALFTDDTRWRTLIVCSGATIVRGFYREPLRFTRTGEGHIVVEGTLDGRALRLGRALDPRPLLPTRGFHRIQDEPFHRQGALQHGVAIRNAPGSSRVATS